MIVIDSSDLKKEKVSTSIETDVKKDWIKFSEEFNYSTLSDLIRDSVNKHIFLMMFLKEKGLNVQITNFNSFFKKLIMESILFNYEKNIHDFYEILTEMKLCTGVASKEFPEERSLRAIKIVKEKLNRLINLLDSFYTDPLKKLVADSLKKPCDILIVDDNKIQLQVFHNEFTSLGFHIEEADSISKALTILQSYTPRLIILDIELRDTTNIKGDKFCIQIKSNPEMQNTPVILISAKRIFNSRKLLEETRASMFLQKPFDIEDLIKTVHEYLGNK